MKQSHTTLTIETRGPGLTDITDDVAAWCSGQDISDGLLTLFIRHTTASLVIQENADPDVLRDLQDFFAALAPQTGSYRHRTEGPDDMPSHIKSALTASHLSLPMVGGTLALGTWQGIYVFEHRDRPHRRNVIAQLMGD